MGRGREGKGKDGEGKGKGKGGERQRGGGFTRYLVLYQVVQGGSNGGTSGRTFIHNFPAPALFGPVHAFFHRA